MNYKKTIFLAIDILAHATCLPMQKDPQLPPWRMEYLQKHVKIAQRQYTTPAPEQPQGRLKLRPRGLEPDNLPRKKKHKSNIQPMSGIIVVTSPLTLEEMLKNFPKNQPKIQQVYKSGRSAKLLSIHNQDGLAINHSIAHEGLSPFIRIRNNDVYVVLFKKVEYKTKVAYGMKLNTTPHIILDPKTKEPMRKITAEAQLSEIKIRFLGNKHKTLLAPAQPGAPLRLLERPKKYPYRPNLVSIYENEPIMPELISLMRQWDNVLFLQKLQSAPPLHHEHQAQEEEKEE